MSEPSFDQIDFGPGYIYQPYPVLEATPPELEEFIGRTTHTVEQQERQGHTWRIPAHVRGLMERRPPLSPAEEGVRELQRQLVEELARETDKAITEALVQCEAGALEIPEEISFRCHPSVLGAVPIPPPEGMFVASTTA